MLSRPFSTIRRSIRNSINFDLASSPTSPVRMISFFETGSPTIPEDPQQPPTFDIPVAPTLNIQDSATIELNVNCSSVSASPVSSTMSTSSSTSLVGVSGLEGSLQSMSLLTSEDDLPKCRALSFTTLRRRRSSKEIRQTRSTEVTRRSWELEDWQKDNLIPEHCLARRNTVTCPPQASSLSPSPVPPSPDSYTTDTPGGASYLTTLSPGYSRFHVLLPLLLGFHFWLL